MICNCGNMMIKMANFWECKIEPDHVHSGCGRIERYVKDKKIDRSKV
jgi:hypothetical protein